MRLTPLGCYIKRDIFIDRTALVKHPDSTKEQANVTSAESYDGSTTRELAMAAPGRPYISFIALIAQVVVAIAAILTVRPVPVLGIALFVIVLVLLPLTWNAWNWWPRYSKSRIASLKKIDSLEPGMWVANPGSRFAVRLWQNPTGSPRNPFIADGLTRDELNIIAPVYVFTETPKGSENA